jgi:hypothetical protein
MAEKKFRKYIILETEVFNKLKQNNVSDQHLSPEEKSMIEILKNNNIPIEKRLKMYHQILFQVNKVSDDDQEKKVFYETPPQTLIKKEPITSAEVYTQSDPKDVKEEQTQSEPASLRSVLVQAKPLGQIASTNTTNIEEPNYNSTLGESYFESENVSSSVQPSFQTPTSSRISFNSRNLSSIYDNDENEFDEDNETAAIITDLRRQSGGPVDLRNFRFRDLNNPDSEVIHSVDTSNNNQYTIDKTPSLMRIQKLAYKSARRKRTEVEKLYKPFDLKPTINTIDYDMDKNTLSFPTVEATSGPSTTRSGLQRGNNLSLWTAFEDFN